MTRPGIVDVGHGPPLVLIPGIQGRWEWMAPAIDALSRHVRVLSFSLNQVASDGHFFDRAADYLDTVLARAESGPTTIAGVSFGGLVAVHYAATRPSRACALVLTSTPGPHWRPDPRSARYARRPRLALPAFALRAIARGTPEILTALPRWTDRGRFTASHLTRVLRYPLRPTQMAAWVQAWNETDLAADCRAIRAPTLVITGEPSLDRVVPVSSSLEYLQLIPGSQHARLDRTGHLGLVTRPDDYAALVTRFVLDRRG